MAGVASSVRVGRSVGPPDFYAAAVLVTPVALVAAVIVKLEAAVAVAVVVVVPAFGVAVDVLVAVRSLILCPQTFYRRINADEWIAPFGSLITARYVPVSREVRSMLSSSVASSMICLV